MGLSKDILSLLEFARGALINPYIQLKEFKHRKIKPITTLYIYTLIRDAI